LKIWENRHGLFWGGAFGFVFVVFCFLFFFGRGQTSQKRYNRKYKGAWQGTELVAALWTKYEKPGQRISPRKKPSQTKNKNKTNQPNLTICACHGVMVLVVMVVVVMVVVVVVVMVGC
jgi:Flp pilus assembly protein TadB